MKPYNKTKLFQIRWNEGLGDPKCFYAYRWVFIFLGYSIRIHKWIRSDDRRAFHDHAWNFRTFVLKGHYFNISDNNGIIVREKVSFTAFRKADHRHYVEVPKEGCITLLFCSRPYRKWGFWVDGKVFKRPLKYFHKFGHPICSEQ